MTKDLKFSISYSTCNFNEQFSRYKHEIFTVRELNDTFCDFLISHVATLTLLHLTLKI